MSQVSGQGTVWNLPNYSGELATADMINTPFLSMIGGLNGLKQTSNFEFPTSSEYDFATAAQPAITETASLTAPTATEAIRGQVKNVTQIFQEAIKISYAKLSNAGRMSGINTVGQVNNAADEKAFQINYKLAKIARDIEYTCLNGVYQIATSAAVANKTRGMIAATSLTGGTSTDASASTLSKTLFENLLQSMFTAGAVMENPVVWVNGFQKRKLSEIYGYAPEDRNVGGANIKQIETDFGVIGVAPAHRFMPAATLLVADMAVVSGVVQPVPEKGNFFYEELAKTGASENGEIFGQFALDHGAAFRHGTLTNLATS